MAAGGSMREALKALTATFSAPTAPYPLPDELQQTIEAFLERYHEIEDHDSQRFHDDLLSLYTKHVAGNSEKHGPFLSALLLVRPALTGIGRLNEWWDLVLKPTLLEGMGHKKREIEDARAFVQSILVFDGEEDKDGEHTRLSQYFSGKILDAYISKTRIPSLPQNVSSLEDEYVAHELETILVAFGRRKPKELLLVLDNLFLQKEYRIQALNLLSAFVRLQPPHLHLVLETSLIQHLEKCLLIDTSSTVIELALMILIMFLPHITGSLTSEYHLAKLFLIYSRILCWDKLESPDKANDEDGQQDECVDDDDSEHGNSSDQPWEKADYSLEYQDTAPPTVLHYFTFLYGLFPLNFMSFIRKPWKFLRSIGFPVAEEVYHLDQDLIHSRTEPYRRVHLLHPNMFTTTIEDEMSENRWVKSDPADVVTECMELCVAISTTLEDPGPAPTSKLPDLPIPNTADIPPAYLDDDSTTANNSGASWRNTQSTMFAASTTGQPELPETFEIPPRSKSIKSVKSVKSIKSSKSSSPLLKCRDVMDSPTLPPLKQDKKHSFLDAPVAAPQRLVIYSPRLDSLPQPSTNTGSNSPLHSEFQNQSMASLQREIMLLRNDLNFERYLKLQHLTHIGQLQRKYIKEATAEAETQNLLNTNKTLKARLAKANELYAQLKKETFTSRSQSKKWEGELSSKIRSYRDDQKVWHSEEDSLRFDLKKTQSDYENLKKIVERAEAEQLKAQQRTRALEFELEDYGNVRRELEAVQEKVMIFEDQSRELDSLIQERNELRNDLEIANMRLNSREAERERAMKAYERRIMELESRLQSAEKNPSKPGQLPSSVQQMLDSALAANNAKLQQLKKTHYRLLDQYTELQMKCHDLEGEREADSRPRPKDNRSHLDNERDTRSRDFDSRQGNNYGSKYLPSLSSPQSPEEYEYYQDYHSPMSANTPPSASSARPTRFESLPAHKPVRELPRELPKIGLGQDFSAAYDASLNAHFQNSNSADMINSSGKSGYSVETNSSKGDKDKKAAKPEMRIYGRGGAQNISKKKDKEKEPKKPGQSKSGGFRGLKNIM